MKKPFSVCVFCGARPGADTTFVEAGREFGKSLALEGMRLVYGAGDIGVMGAVAQGTADNGGNTFGVIPQHLVDAEIAKTDVTSLVVTENMHERKKVMFMNCDAIALLPGGAGSLDEFFEVLTWAQIGLHKKPIFLLNINGYWDPLHGLLAHIVKNGFADPSVQDIYTMVADVDSLMAALRDARS